MITKWGSTFPQTGEMPSPTEKIKDKRSYYQSKLWNVSQQKAYAWVSEFINFIISSTMFKVKLWTSWTYDTKGIICIYDKIDQQENQSFQCIHAWLGKRIQLLIVKW